MRGDLRRCIAIAGSILFVVSVAVSQDVVTDEDAPRLTSGQRLPTVEGLERSR